MDLCATPAVELARLIRSRELSATELLTAVLARIGEVNPALNAIVTLTAEQAAAVAAGLDQRAARGSFAGLTPSGPGMAAPGMAAPGMAAPGMAALPVGLQLVGRYGADRRLLEIAAAVMRLTADR